MRSTLSNSVVTRQDFSRVFQALRKRWRSWQNDQSGVASVEYAIILALISAVSLGAVSAIGRNASTVFEEVQGHTEREAEPQPAMGETGN